MEKEKKRRAKEMPKARFILLFIMMIVFVYVPIRYTTMPKIACILLGIFNADVFYFLFIVIKVQRMLKEKKHIDVHQEESAHDQAKLYAKEIAGEGIVMLENNGLLPLQKNSKINVFSLRAVQLQYNGGGSAASDESECVTLEEGLQSAGFELNQDLLNIFYNYLKNQSYSIASPGKNYKVKKGATQKAGAEFVSKPGSPVKVEMPIHIFSSTSLYNDGKTVYDHAKEFSDVAMVVISRGGGEGYDFDIPDLQLIQSEKDMLDDICKHFDKVIVLINSANVMELGWIKEYPSIKGALWIGFPGTSGMLAVGDILNGTINPSGHLSDIYPRHHINNPTTHNFLELKEDGLFDRESYHYNNVPEKKGYFINYHEGIYVGYKYYETRAVEDESFNYDEEVVYPFGYGLSYTTFKQEILAFDGTHLHVSITNTGNTPGKEVVQVYSTPPYYKTIEKSAVNLVAFAKTDVLQPQETVELTLEITQRELASFDMSIGKWHLEKGDYILSLRSNSHDVLDCYTYTLDEDVILEGTSNLFEDANIDSLTREFNEEHCAFTGPKEEYYQASDDVIQALDYVLPTDQSMNLTQADMPKTNQKVGMKIQDMVDVPKNDEKWKTFVEQLSVEEMCHLCGNGAWQIAPLPSIGLPHIIVPDGSTSIASTVFSALVMGKRRKGIIWPCPPVLASTFNEHMGWLEGEGVGKEGNAMGYHGWYAPSMNNHRTPFNSRNFEYYSEDGLLAGKIAANVVRGVQENKITVFLKHFAVNERETHARDQLFTYCSEQALREIYFKPFEYAVKEGKALGVMSSFNYIGHTWAGGDYNLLTKMLREEWGFEGCVVTDACLYPHMNVAQMLYAGGNLSLDTLGGLTGGSIKRRSLLAQAQNSSRQILMTKWLQKASLDILYTASKLV